MRKWIYLKKQPFIPLNILGLNLLFSLFYWVMESVRDVIVFNKGSILERIFRPDPMSFWMRMMVICIFMLFSIFSGILREQIEGKRTTVSIRLRNFGIIWIGIGFSLLYWFLEAFRDVFVFSKGGFFQRLFQPDAMGFWMRMMVVFFLILFSSYVQATVNQHRKIEQKLREAYAELEQRVEKSGTELSRSNEILIQQVALRERTQYVLKQMNNTLTVLSACSDVLNRANDEKKMLNEICSTIVGIGNFPLVWVSAVERKGKVKVSTVAQSVRQAVDIQLVEMTTSEFMDDQNPIGLALKSGKPGLTMSLSKLDKSKLWVYTALNCRYTSLLSLPLKDKDDVFAVLSMYAADSGVFDDEPLKLLGRLADNLAFGLIAARSRSHGSATESPKE